MPQSIFLSYSSSNDRYVQSIERALRQLSWQVWRDHSSLRAGERWPKILAQAIQDSMAMVLVWSEAASKSDFVELEWNIALAQKKTIIPVLTDQTPLPVALSATHGIRVDTIAGVVDRITASLAPLSTPFASVTPSDPRQDIAKAFEKLVQAEPKQALASLKLVVEQPGWNVSGQVYQAAGDIHIHNEPAAKASTANSKPLRERWQVWVGIVVSLLTAGTLLRQLIGGQTPSTLVRDSGRTTPDSKVGDNQLVKIGGTVTDEQGIPIKGAMVAMTGQDGLTLTDQSGAFSLPAAPSSDMVRLIITKDGYRNTSEYFPLRSDVRVVLRKN